MAKKAFDTQPGPEVDRPASATPLRTPLTRGRTGLWDSLEQRLAEKGTVSEPAPRVPPSPAEPSAAEKAEPPSEARSKKAKKEPEVVLALAPEGKTPHGTETPGEDSTPAEAPSLGTPTEPTPSDEEAFPTPPFPALQKPEPTRFGRLRRRLSHRVDAGGSKLWQLVFRWLGVWWNLETSVLEPRGGRKILMISARPGDEVAGCAAALLAHTRNGDRVTVLQVTAGVDRPAFGLPETRSTEFLRHESEEAARSLGFEVVWSGLRAADELLDRATGEIGKLLDRLQPAVVYSPSRLEPDPTVDFATRALARALEQRREEDDLPVIRVYGHSVPLTPILTHLVATIPKADLSHLAFTTYLSRRTQLERQIRRRQLAAGLWQVPHLAEELWQLEAHAFHRLHRQKPSRPPAKTFRAITRPWSDPLAYLRGRRERQRFARQALLGPMLFR